MRAATLLEEELHGELHGHVDGKDRHEVRGLCVESDVSENEEEGRQEQTLHVRHTRRRGGSSNAGVRAGVQLGKVDVGGSIARREAGAR